MITRHRCLAIVFCVAASSTLVASCGGPAPEMTEVRPTAIATSTPSAVATTPEELPTPTWKTPAVIPPPSFTPTAPLTTPPIEPSEQRYEDRGTPVSLLASYYNAYWENPPNSSYGDFMQGYAETQSVFVAVRPPTAMEGAAGSTYASVPALLIATHADGHQHAFVGCFVARRSNTGVGGTPADGEWSLYHATVSATPDNIRDATLLVQACEPIPPESAYEDREGPVRLLASYFNAINRKEYRRAWEYWESPPNRSYEDFEKGYAETASVLLVVRPPVRVEGAAGSMYAGIPTLLVATHIDGSRHAFVGCYVGRRVNPGTGGVDEGWSLYDAAVNAISGNNTDVTLLIQACET
jgi:hypothetical protein